MATVSVGFSEDLLAAIQQHGSVGGPKPPENLCCGVSNPEHALVWWDPVTSTTAYVLEQATQPTLDSPLSSFSELWRGDTCQHPVQILQFHGQSLVFRVCAVDRLDCTGRWSQVSRLKISPAKTFTPGAGPALSWGGVAGDASGIVHYIATEGGTQPWTNPASSGKMEVTRSKSGIGQPAHALQNDEAKQSCTGDQPDSWVCFDFRTLRVRPTHYALRHGFKQGTHRHLILPHPLYPHTSCIKGYTCSAIGESRPTKATIAVM